MTNEFFCCDSTRNRDWGTFNFFWEMNMMIIKSLAPGLGMFRQSLLERPDKYGRGSSPSLGMNSISIMTLTQTHRWLPCHRLHRERRLQTGFVQFESLKKGLDKLPVENAILDGEVVCLDENDVSQYNELLSKRSKPVFYAFDLLCVSKYKLKTEVLHERGR